MKDFSHWGVRVRASKPHNYQAIWNNLATVRLGEGQAKELPPAFSEFYDVGINTVCNAECDFCYVSATGNGINFPDICETWTKWMYTYSEKEVKEGITVTNKPFQIAIGSTGEPTIHPQFCEFLETVHDTSVVPNYTTNGITLATPGYERDKLLDYTQRFVGGVAVSTSNREIANQAADAIALLIKKDITNINVHSIISDMNSVNEFIARWTKYGDSIKYHVLLPLMPSGRSKEGIQEGVWEYLEEQILSNGITNVAFGAHFINTLETSKIKTWLYPAESMSKNVILTKDCVKITPSSFDLKPIMEIKL